MKTEKNEDQEFYNEIMRESWEAEEKRDKEIADKNELLIRTLLNMKGFDYVAKFLHDFIESECHGEITFCEKPIGQKQSDSWGRIKGVWVEQHCEMEDSYWGNIYFPVSDDKYLKCHFAC